MKSLVFIATCLSLVGGLCFAQATPGADDILTPRHPRQDPFIKRPFDPTLNGRWVGNAVCYGPHRDGQSPDGDQPSRDELLEDLKIMNQHWSMIRMYGSEGATETVLELIKEHGLPMKVVVGAWIATEERLDEAGNVVERFPDTAANNKAQVASAIRLANAYPDLVAAITVGNETQVFWSFHKVQTPTLINYIRRVRAETSVPVSTADVSTHWALPESKPLADELDFIVTHIYAMWNQQQLDNAMAWTKEQYAAGLAMHPGHQFVIGEAGWATTRMQEGEQANYILGVANEDNQKQFHTDFAAWTTAEKIPNFFFEAFDENWKGGDHPDEVEKHWGLYNADRTPKKTLSAE